MSAVLLYCCIAAPSGDQAIDPTLDSGIICVLHCGEYDAVRHALGGQALRGPLDTPIRGKQPREKSRDPLA